MNTKKWLLFVLLFWILPCAVHAQFTFSTNTDGSLTLTYFSGTNGFAIIPAYVNGAAVTGIGPYAFTYPNRPNVWPVATNIEIPATVTTLAPHAFSGMETYGTGFLMGAYFLGNAPIGTNAFDYFTPDPYTVETVIYHLAGTTGFDTNLFQGPIQVWYPGQLQVGLSPTNAVLEGAEWRVDGGPWQTNDGMVGNLSSGNHTVSFKTIAGWEAPSNETVNVGQDFITVVTGPSYTPLPGGPSHTFFQVLHTFAPTLHNLGGSQAPLLLVSNILYGTTQQGGEYGQGTIFTINPDGTGFTNIYTFTNGGCYSALIQSSNVLYGCTWDSVFRVNLDGSCFNYLYESPSIATAENGVVLVSNTLYSTTQNGGANGSNAGMIFAINTDGTGFRDLHDFGSISDDGGLPLGGLVANGNTLYGTTQQGFIAPGGFPYAIQTDGNGYTNFPYPGGYICTMTLAGNVLYGNSGGGLFRMNLDGSDLIGLPTGGDSQASVIVAGNTLYGTTWYANSAIYPWEPGYFGTVFAVHTDGTGCTNLYTFSGGDYVGYTGGPDGAHPAAGVILYGTTLYGTTPQGGTNGNGTVYMLSFPHPQLGMSVSGTNLVFSWPSGTVGAGYDLFSVQATTNLTSPCAWCALPMAPVLVNGMNTVTNPIPATATLYRLSQKIWATF